MPPLVKPTLAAESYRARLAKIVGGAIRSGYAPLLDALPRLAAAMETQRSDSVRRGDASPVDEASKLAGKAAQELGGSGFKKQVRAEVKRASDNVAAHTKGQLRKKLDEHPDERIRARKLTDGPRLKPIIEGFAAENVALITGIAPQLASQVQALVVQGLTSGVPHERLARQIRDKIDVSARRAELIAVDQVGKLNGQLSAQRAQDLGVTHFFWRTLNDERVRGNPDGRYPDAQPSHWLRNGKRYAYADLPKGKDGEPELPGTPINCRCYADPDLSTLIQPVAPASESTEAQAEPTPAPRSVDDMEAEAARMMAEVEEFLARQQAEFEERMRPPEPPPAPPPQDEQLDDPAHEAQAQGLVAQLASAPPAAAETALARYRRWKRRGRQVRGDQLRTDYSPDQPRASDGRFGEVAGSHEGKADPDSEAASPPVRASGDAGG